MAKSSLNESKVGDMTKEELKSFIRDVVSDELGKEKNKSLNEKDVKSIVRDMLKKHYRILWTNASFYLDKL